MALDAKAVGAAGLQGWRAKLADRTAGPVAARTPLDEDQWSSLVGGVFLALSVLYVVNAIRAVAAER